ncbi:TonB-dependent receptor [Sphingomonas sp. BK235]|uniref:TonB-dependent receptor plug domain-containing protein n=1 Tax=Sphingomonas sp. BK235 TaxID=2512131 RepID=UPI00104CB358|nr:TonB-dependent receptor [Sphingomonas sp. BK235]TCP31889.1 iron complex outermembrane receptor protein [Sphingomonas sp. BK235]
MTLTRSALGLLRQGVSAAALLVALAGPARAQTQAQTAIPDAAAAEQPAAPGRDIIVTGTLFRDSNASQISPVTVLSADTLARAHMTTAQEAIRSISADGAGSISTGFRNGFSAGGAAVSLRGLGVSSTVVLIDGLRSANFPLNDDGHNAYVDLNSIPFSIVDRIEVLKDGASSTYGADAIGGVVNLITRRNVQGIDGSVEAGTTAHGDGGHTRATLTVGHGDYTTQGWNLYVNAEYTADNVITNHARGYPFNTLDLRPSGLADRNRNHDSLTADNPEAVVTRVTQSDLDNPLAGRIGAPLTRDYRLIDPASCPHGRFTVDTARARGTGCAHNLPDEYLVIQPRQQRYSTTGRLSLRLGDALQAFATASYSHSDVAYPDAPSRIRQTQPFGGSTALASNNPGIVLPVYVCAAGHGCATAADRRLNPNNPYAAAFADRPGEGAARIYYRFGDIPTGTDRYVDVVRTSAGISGELGGGFSFRLNGVFARDDLGVTQHGFLRIRGLLDAINTGAYDFVDPRRNTAAVRRQVAPDRTTRSHATMATIGGSLLNQLATLPGGDLNLGAGFQLRRETLLNPNANADLSYYTLNTSSARGRQTVTAGFFEIDAPLVRQLHLNLSGRYDRYSLGYGHFSPKAGVMVTPVTGVALRATYAQGFRAPTFAENNAASSYAGFSSFAPPASFVAAHAGNAGYYSNYNLGSGSIGNPAIHPEVSRSLTLGTIVRPARWFDLTVDYYRVRKTNLIVSGPLRAAAIGAYYGQADAAAGCAALAAVGPGYRCNVVDAPDPDHPQALPRLLVFDVPFVNASAETSAGVDIQGNATVALAPHVRWTSRLDVTDVLRLDLVTPEGVVQRYAGTLGPYELSSGGGTPRLRGNWQNALDIGAVSLAATAYYVGRIKQVAADEAEVVDGRIDLSCAHSMAPLLPGGDPRHQCYVRPFVYVDLDAAVRVGDRLRLFVDVGNVTGARAPLASAAYTSNPNYLSSWHYPGLVGRNLSAGARFRF